MGEELGKDGEEGDGWMIFNDDCLNVLGSQTFLDMIRGKNVVIVTDPPFNVGYHYEGYKDNLPEDEYYKMLGDVFLDFPFVVIHYPESIYKIAFRVGKFPEKVVSWVYNSNTAKQHRDIAFFGVKPDFRQVTQPYKNLNDKRIKQRIADGCRGGRLYDWWNVNQVKNVSRDKTEHPCQMPQEVMNNIIGILPRENLLVVDPFMGSGTTGIACKKYDVDFIGIEMNERYFEIAKSRLEGYNEQMSLF